MIIWEKLKKKIIEAHYIWRSYDCRLIFGMIYNRLKYKSHLDFLKADRPYKFNFLRRHYGHILQNCKENPTINTPNNGPIWVCWWQGEDKMPDIVRFCYESLKRNAPPDRDVILLNQNNYKEYVEIPEYIIYKREKKRMLLNHFSDILRMSVLAKHGGLWVDSTVFVSEKISADIFKLPYFSGREPFMDTHVCECKFTLFLLGSAANAPWIVYARNVLYEYWKKSWKQLDYALTDYILTLAFNEIPELMKNVENGVISTPHINTVQDKRNDPVDSAEFKKMLSECSFYKLSYKLDFKERDINGNMTYYGMLRSAHQFFFNSKL